MTDDLLPEFAFKHARHDRISDRRGDPEFLAAAWADPATRVVVIRDAELVGHERGHQSRYRGTRPCPARAADAARQGGRCRLLPRARGRRLRRRRPLRSDDGRDFRPLRTIATSLDPVQASLAVHAVALAQWHERHSHCAVCGAQTESAMSGESRRCPRLRRPALPAYRPGGDHARRGRRRQCLLGHNAARDATLVLDAGGLRRAGGVAGGRGRARSGEETGWWSTGSPTPAASRGRSLRR